MASALIEHNDVHRIITIFLEDPVLTREKLKLCRALGIQDALAPACSTPYEFLIWVLDNWISQEDEATMEKLITILRQEKFYATSEKLQYKPHSANRVWFDMREKVAEFTGRAEVLRDLHQSMIERRNDQITVITTVHGLGGIGKTSLAVHYAWTYRNTEFYHNVVWINAETAATIIDSFNRLAEILGISTVDKKSNHIGFRSIVLKIYQFFSGRQRQNTLFILDNSRNYESIKECLPPPQTPDSTPPFILLTSRNRKWGDNVKKISLNVFTGKESLEFFINYLQLQTESEIVNASAIAEMLQNLPLAVRQAGAYIKMQTREGFITREDSMREYIAEFDTNSKELLGFEHAEQTNDPNYEQTTLLTWNVTLKKIREINPYTEVIMHVISYLNPVNIPPKLLESLTRKELEETGIVRLLRKIKRQLKSETKEVTFMRAIKLLTEYSMINVHNYGRPTLSVHRLVQRVVRIQVEELLGFKKLGQCVKLFQLLFESLGSDSDQKILMQAQTLTANINISKLSNEYEGFVKLVDNKLQIMLEKQITIFQHFVEKQQYDQAFELSRTTQLSLSNNSKYVLYIQGTFLILLEHIESLNESESEDLESLFQMYTELIDKTYYRRNINDHMELMINEVKPVKVNEFKYLGEMFDTKLIFKKHVELIEAK